MTIIFDESVKWTGRDTSIFHWARKEERKRILHIFDKLLSEYNEMFGVSATAYSFCKELKQRIESEDVS